jgi:hypothetical protein
MPYIVFYCIYTLKRRNNPGMDSAVIPATATSNSLEVWKHPISH